MTITALHRGDVLTGKLAARMLRKRFQTVVFLAFLVVGVAMASENIPNDEDEEQLPQCPAISATSGKRTRKIPTDDGYDGKADDDADNEADDGDGDGDDEAGDGNPPPEEERPCVPAMEEQTTDDDTPSTNDSGG